MLTLEELLAETCATSRHPVALVEESGKIVTASPTFLHPGTVLLVDKELEDLVLLQVGDFRLAVSSGAAMGRAGIEALAVEARRQASQARRQGTELSLALRAIDVLQLMAQVVELLAAPTELADRLAAISDLVASRFPAKPRFVLSFGVGSGLAEAVDETVLHSSPTTGVQATASHPGALDEEQLALLGALLERVAAAGVRHALDSERSTKHQSRALLEFTALLAHELNSPLTTLTSNLTLATESLALGDTLEASALLAGASVACKRVLAVSRQLFKVSSGGGRYHRISLVEILARLGVEARDGAREPVEDLFVIGDPSEVGPALELLAASLAGARTAVSVTGTRIVLRVDRRDLRLPGALSELGVEVVLDGEATEVRLPFRML